MAKFTCCSHSLSYSGPFLSLSVIRCTCRQPTLCCYFLPWRLLCLYVVLSEELVVPNRRSLRYRALQAHHCDACCFGGDRFPLVLSEFSCFVCPCDHSSSGDARRFWPPLGTEADISSLRCNTRMDGSQIGPIVALRGKPRENKIIPSLHSHCHCIFLKADVVHRTLDLDRVCV